MLQRKRLGIAVVGSGRIGTMRARATIAHPSVKETGKSMRPSPASCDYVTLQ